MGSLPEELGIGYLNLLFTGTKMNRFEIARGDPITIKDYEIQKFNPTGLWSPNGWSVPVNTAVELVAELERQLAGFTDKHDIFIEEFIKNKGYNYA